MNAAQLLGIKPVDEWISIHHEPTQSQLLDCQLLASRAHGEGPNLGLLDALLVEILAIANLAVQLTITSITTIITKVDRLV